MYSHTLDARMGRRIFSVGSWFLVCLRFGLLGVLLGGKVQSLSVSGFSGILFSWLLEQVSLFLGFVLSQLPPPFPLVHLYQNTFRFLNQIEPLSQEGHLEVTMKF